MDTHTHTHTHTSILGEHIRKARQLESQECVLLLECALLLECVLIGEHIRQVRQLQSGSAPCVGRDAGGRRSPRSYHLEHGIVHTHTVRLTDYQTHRETDRHTQ